MNKTLSWKVLLPLAVGIWLLGKFLGEAVIGDILGVAATIIGVLGLVDFFRNLGKKEKIEKITASFKVDMLADALGYRFDHGKYVRREEEPKFQYYRKDKETGDFVPIP